MRDYKRTVAVTRTKNRQKMRNQLKARKTEVSQAEIDAANLMRNTKHTPGDMSKIKRNPKTGRIMKGSIFVPKLTPVSGEIAADIQNVKRKFVTGRTPLYKPIYAKLMLEYFMGGPDQEYSKELGRVKSTRLPTFEGFASTLRVPSSYLYKWRDDFPDFRDAFLLCKDKVKDKLINETLAGSYQSSFAIFVAKNLTDMRDDNQKQSSGGINIQLNVGNSNLLDNTNSSTENTGFQHENDSE